MHCSVVALRGGLFHCSATVDEARRCRQTARNRTRNPTRPEWPRCKAGKLTERPPALVCLECEHGTDVMDDVGRARDGRLHVVLVRNAVEHASWSVDRRRLLPPREFWGCAPSRSADRVVGQAVGGPEGHADRRGRVRVVHHDVTHAELSRGRWTETRGATHSWCVKESRWRSPRRSHVITRGAPASVCSWASSRGRSERCCPSRGGVRTHVRLMP